MIMALVFFLVALFVSMLILIAATSNVTKSQNRYEDEQTFIAANSAFRIVTKDVEAALLPGSADKKGIVFAAEQTAIRHDCGQKGSCTDTTSDWSIKDPPDYSKSVIAGFIYRNVPGMLAAGEGSAGSTPGPEESFTLDAVCTGDSNITALFSKYETVVKLQMDNTAKNRFNINGVITVSRSGEIKYTRTFVIKAKTNNVEVRKKDGRCNHTSGDKVSWYDIWNTKTTATMQWTKVTALKSKAGEIE